MANIAIRNGNLWDGTGGPVAPGVDVLISDDRITAVGANRDVPAGYDVIDAAGKTVMPGLIDMHVHVDLCGEDSLFGFLGTGVTSVRDLGSNVATSLPRRDAIAQGDRVGPRTFVYGPLLDGEPTVLGQAMDISVVTGSAEDGAAIIDELIGQGVDGIKLYAGLRPDLLQALVKTVDSRVPVTGHLGRTWASEAARAGINCLEHLHATAYQDVVRPEDRHGREDGNGGRPDYWTWLCAGWARADLDAEYVGEFIEVLVQHEVALSPTTVLITGGWATNEAASEPGLKYRPRFMSERLREREEAADKDSSRPRFEPVDPETGAQTRANQLEFLRRLHAAGGVVVPSTDVGAAPQQVPGFSLHRELALLVEAGIDNASVLGDATRTAASVLGWADDLGTLEAGKLADMLVIDGNPVEDIDATRNVEHVIKDGVSYLPQDLLDRIEI